MHKFNTTQQKLYVICLVTCQQNGGREGGAYFKSWAIGGALIQRGHLFEDLRYLDSIALWLYGKRYF